MSVDFSKMMDAAGEMARAHGMDFRGKKYSTVAQRVEVFRRAYGDAASISTEIVHLGMVNGEPIIMRAAISLDGRVIATGTAWEVIGKGNVNQSSALENCETSAVGRALAVLGLHGGEMASANEMSRIDEKPSNPSAEGLMQAWEDAVMDGLPEDPEPDTLANAYAAVMMTEVARFKSGNGLDGYLKRHAGHVRFVQQHAPEAHAQLREAVTEHRKTFQKEAA